MADPISIAGLAIAILDDLVSLTKWTAEVIGDVRAFDSDTERLNNLLSSDMSRSQLLKNLLFAETTVYGGQTLFDQFEERDQQEVVRQLEATKNILQEGHDLLNRRYGIAKGSTANSSSTSLQGSMSSLTLVASSTPSNPTSPITRSRSPASMKVKILWSLRDKERVQEIIDKFNEQHRRIEGNVKLWCLASQLGVNPDHLRRLQVDSNSKLLGFDIDATLKLTQQSQGETAISLELPDKPWVEDIQTSTSIPEASCFRYLSPSTSKETFIQENHLYNAPDWWRKNHDFTTSSLDPNTLKRVEALAKLLHQPKEQVFRIPKCIGWRYSPDSHQVSFIFRSPHKPISLQYLLSNASSKTTPTPELGEKFRLAAGLAACIAQLHMVGWLHESFRSENVLLFPEEVVHDDLPLELDFGNPQVLGFEFSRLDVNRTRFISDFNPTRDLYRHPQRQGPEPEVTFSRIHDIYALGVVLLEIGLWEPAIKLKKDQFRDAKQSDAYRIQAQLLNHAEHRLEKRVGKKYKHIVVKCLKGDFGVTNDNKEDLKLQQAFRAQVLDVLERAADAV